MTQGVIWKHLLAFALPLMVGNLFQQLYNTVDSIVVGQFVSKQALAAVGSTTSIINMMVGFFSGVSVGAGVVISQRFGAKDPEGVHKAVHTTISLTLIIGLIGTLVGIFLAPIMLTLMKTPQDVFVEAKAYLQIYFGGISGLMLYNMGSGILRAVGDSRRPLYFLVFSSCVNIVLDLLFVLVFHMGVKGVAVATIIAQFASAALIYLTLYRTHDVHRFQPSKLRIYPAMVKSIIRVGLPSGLQQALTSFSNVFVQSYINSFGTNCVAGWSCYHRIDQFILLPMQSISMASTTFVGQNIGHRDLERTEKGIRTAVTLSIVVTGVLITLVCIFCVPLIKVFNDDPAVLEYGRNFIRMISPFYLIICFNQIYAGALRGAGDAKAPMIIMLFSFVLFRQIYLAVGTQFPALNNPWFVGLGYPAGWAMCSTLQLLYYYKSKWRERCKANWAAEDAAKELKTA
ncbi:MAG: MATE family efflux transporter [Clostridia bacterium]|nr:MATE family efflux transporter [Clostridia bacterium]